ncbi:MAG: heme-binding protein [Pseudomonadota bacterium]
MLSLLRTAALAVFSVVAMPVTAENNIYNGYQIPNFTVSVADGPFELRRYDSHIVAELEVEGSRGSAIRQGFRGLAGYIFGKNSGSEKISMTAPVTQTATGDAWRVQFMMPRSHDVADLPRPNNDQISIRETEPETQAVIGFSGLWSDQKLRKKTQELKAWVASKGLKTVGDPRYYFYNDPFTLPWKRRNEVAFLIE